MNVRTLALVSAFALALPVAANAQGSAIPRGQQQQQYGARGINSPAYRAGLERGTRDGQEDGRRNRQFDFASKSDYRSADAGWNRNYGDRELYRSDFRVGFETGYREGYARYNSTYGTYGNNGNYGTYGNGSYGNNNGRGNGTYRSTPPPWANGRGRGNSSWQRNDLAFQNGFTDGYDAGLRDANSRNRFDPVGESRYRSGDHGYKSNYGSRDTYKFQYRDAFREGYEYGFQEGTQYGQYGQNGQSGQNGTYGRNTNSRPSWWPW